MAINSYKINMLLCELVGLSGMPFLSLIASFLRATLLEEENKHGHTIHLQFCNENSQNSHCTLLTFVPEEKDKIIIITLLLL